VASPAAKDEAAKQPRWHKYVPAMVDGRASGWCEHCGAPPEAEWHRFVAQAGDPPTIDSVLQKLEWCTGDFSVPIKPAEAALLVPIVRAHLGRPPT